MLPATLRLLAALLGLAATLLPGPGAAQILPGTLAAGNAHNVLLLPDGRLRTWGSNDAGQLGQGTMSPTGPVGQPGAAATYAQVAAGSRFTVALRADGTLWAWGDNTVGQLGTGGGASQTSPVQVGTGTTWKQVAAGYATVTALQANGTLWTWGFNQGVPTGLPYQLVPRQVGTGSTWLSVAAGDNLSLAIRADGTLWAWGLNASGQLGNGTTLSTTADNPVQVGTATTWLTVEAGNSHVLGVRADGTLWAWGNNTNGELGNGGTVSSLVPSQVGAGRLWRQVSAGTNGSAAIAADGTLWAWGNNDQGQLGTGSGGSPLRTPFQVGSATTWVSVSKGEYHTLALQANGSVWAWGVNQQGQLGNGGTAQLNVPTPVAGVAGLPTRRLAVGRYHSAGITPTGRLTTWGRNDSGQLGDGTTTSRPNPAPVAEAGPWVQVAASADSHTLALRADGTLWAWGANSEGRLGDGTTTPRLSPVQVGTDRRWRQVAAGAVHSVALAADGTLWAWGFNTSGTVGDGTTLTRLSPVAVGASRPWRQVAAGGTHTQAIAADGTLWSWGGNFYGQLGDGTTTSRLSPVLTGSGITWVQVASGYGHSLALRADGTLWNWGSNQEGQLGDGTQTGRLSPVPVGSATTWVQVAAGGYFSAARQASGALYAWGNNYYGQLGDDTNFTRVAPMLETVSGQRWLTVAAGGTHALARTANGNAFYSTGQNDYGQLGDGTTRGSLVYTRAGNAAGQPLPVRAASAGPLAGAAPTLYPNPAVGPATLHGIPAGAVVQVLDATGRLVLAATADGAGEATLALPAGFYVVRTGQQVLRLAVQ